MVVLYKVTQQAKSNYKYAITRLFRCRKINVQSKGMCPLFYHLVTDLSQTKSATSSRIFMGRSPCDHG